MKPWGGKNNLIVSFTSFPARINDVWKVVVSLKNQSMLPEKIILWLSKEQFPSRNSIPQSLLSQEDNLFTIRMVDGDLRSHKKYYYMLREFPKKSFITCDDDVIYDSDMIKRLVDCEAKYPGCIAANQTWKIRFEDDGNVKTYIDWGPVGKPFDNTDLMQVGIGGVLYPRNSLYKNVVNKDVFMSVIPMADDIWLNCMARLACTPIVQTERNVINMPIINGSPSLTSENNNQGKNDIQLIALRKYLQDNSLCDVYKK